VPTIPPLSGNELASVACSLENKASLCGVSGLCVATPLQRRCTSPQKEGTTGIHTCVFGLRFSVTSYSYLHLVSILLTRLHACFSLLGNSPSCTSSEFTLCQALKLKRVKICVVPIHHRPLVALKILSSTFYLYASSKRA
jgi:hypothetical protein